MTTSGAGRPRTACAPGASPIVMGGSRALSTAVAEDRVPCTTMSEHLVSAGTVIADALPGMMS